VGLRAGLDECGKYRPTAIRSPDRPARSKSLYRLNVAPLSGESTNLGHAARSVVIVPPTELSRNSAKSVTRGRNLQKCTPECSVTA